MPDCTNKAQQYQGAESPINTSLNAEYIQLDAEDHDQALLAANDAYALIDAIQEPTLSERTRAQLLSIAGRRIHDIRAAITVLS